MKMEGENREVHGLYTNIGEIENNTLALIEIQKNELMFGMSEMMHETAVIKLNSVVNSMILIVEKYFRSTGSIKSFKPDGYSIYELKEYIPFAENVGELQILCNYIFTIYNHYAKILGVSVPTSFSDYKKKIVSTLFGISNREVDMDELKEELIEKFKLTKLPDNPTNFFYFCISSMKDHDLNCDGLLLGFKRAGKSTLMLQAVRKLTMLRNHFTTEEQADEFLVKGLFADKNIFYDQRQNLNTAMKSMYEQILCVDEGFLIMDRRQSMSGSLVKLTQTINECGDRLNITLTLIQDYLALERRVVGSVNFIMFVVARGQALLFSADKTFASLVRDLFGFDYLTENQWIFRQDREKVIARLKALPSYIADIEWEQLGDNLEYNKSGKSGNEFYDMYLNNKKDRTGAVSRIETDKEFKIKFAEKVMQDLKEKGYKI